MKPISPRLLAGVRVAGPVLVTWALLGLPGSTALGEPPLSPVERARQERYFFLVLGGVVLTLAVLSAAIAAVVLLFARDLRTWRRFLLVTAAAFVALAAVGIVTGVLPAVLVFAALAGAGRTM